LPEAKASSSYLIVHGQATQLMKPRSILSVGSPAMCWLRRSPSAELAPGASSGLQAAAQFWKTPPRQLQARNAGARCQGNGELLLFSRSCRHLAQEKPGPVLLADSSSAIGAVLVHHHQLVSPSDAVKAATKRPASFRVMRITEAWTALVAVALPGFIGSPGPNGWILG